MTSDLDNVYLDPNRYKPKSFLENDGYHPPPWNPHEYPERTIGWLEFQKCLKENPEAYGFR